MTPDRITRLHGFVEAEAGVRIAYVYSDTILRLIDERDVLLMAAQGAVAVMEQTDYGLANVRSTLAAAIAKAEAP